MNFTYHHLMLSFVATNYELDYQPTALNHLRENFERLTNYRLDTFITGSDIQKVIDILSCEKMTLVMFAGALQEYKYQQKLQQKPDGITWGALLAAISTEPERMEDYCETVLRAGTDTTVTRSTVRQLIEAIDQGLVNYGINGSMHTALQKLYAN